MPAKGTEKAKAAVAATVKDTEQKTSTLRSVVSTLLLGVLVLALTCGYYIYRLSRVEKAGGADSLYGTRGGDEARSGMLDASAVRTDAKASVNVGYQYGYHRYFTLRPGIVLVNETVLNPQLLLYYGSDADADAIADELEKEMKETAADDHSEERRKSERVLTALRSTPPYRRYVLSHTELGRRYMLRLSYLGSPSVSYRFYLYHIRASTLKAEEERVRAACGRSEVAELPDGIPVDARRMPAGLAHFVPMDTEVATIATHRRYAAQFAEDVTIVYDGADLQRLAAEQEAEAEEGEAAVGGGGTAEDGGSSPHRAKPYARREDPFVAVVEVMPSVLSFAEDPRDFPTMSYNLQLNPLTLNIVPDIALPLIGFFSLVCMVLGRTVVYPWLSAAVIASAECGTEQSEDEQ